MPAVVAVARLWLRPVGVQSGLSRKSTVTRAAAGSTMTSVWSGMPSGTPGKGSTVLVASARPAGRVADGGDGHALGVVEPLAHEGLDGVETELLAELLDAALADAGGGQHGQVVAVPDLGDADALAAHADDVVSVGVVLLDLDAGEDEGALGVDVDGFGRVGGGDGIARVGEVGLGAGGEDVLASKKTGTITVWSAAWVLPR